MTTPPNPTPANDPTVRRVLAFFTLISAVLVAVVAIAVRNINRSELGSDWVNHTHAVILEADAVLVSAHEGESALRAFVMSGSPRDQIASREALAAMSEHVEIAKALTRDEPVQHGEVLQLETLANRRADLAQAVQAAWQRDRAEAVRILTAGDAAAATMSEIRRVVEKLKTEEMGLLAQRDTASYLQAQTTRWTVWTGVTLDLLLLGGAAWLIRDDLAARRRAALALREANEQLETRVRERTVELVAANTKLSTENMERQWANQALEHQLRYNQLIVDSINDLVFVLTKSLNITRINPAVIHLTGLETPELINQPLARFVRLMAGAGDQPLRDPIAQALKDGRDLAEQPAILEDKRGRQMPVRFSLFPLRDQNKVVGGIVVLRIRPSDAKHNA